MGWHWPYRVSFDVWWMAVTRKLWSQVIPSNPLQKPSSWHNTTPTKRQIPRHLIRQVLALYFWWLQDPFTFKTAFIWILKYWVSTSAALSQAVICKSCITIASSNATHLYTSTMTRAILLTALILTEWLLNTVASSVLCITLNALGAIMPFVSEVTHALFRHLITFTCALVVTNTFWCAKLIIKFNGTLCKFQGIAFTFCQTIRLVHQYYYFAIIVL